MSNIHLINEDEVLYLVHHVPDHVLWEELVAVVVALLHELVEVLLHVLKHKVQRVILTNHLIKCNVREAAKKKNHISNGRAINGKKEEKKTVFSDDQRSDGH